MRALYLFSLLFLSLPVFADRTKPCDLIAAILRKDAKFTTEMKMLFVRDASEAATVDEDYLHNTREATQFFSGWFDADAPTDYEAMIRQMQILVARGKTGKRPYRRKNDNHLALVVDESGVFRNETKRYKKALQRINEQVHALTSPEIASMNKLGIKFPPDVLEPLDFLYGEQEGSEYKVVRIPSRGWRTRIQGIPDEALPTTVENIFGAFAHFYPDPKYVPLYVERMAGLMKKLKDVDREYQKTGKLPARAFTLLADYHHTGVNGLVFLRINNSWLMAQVNFLLLRWGQNGIPHGELDIDALYAPDAQYRKLFRTAVTAANSAK